MYVSPLNSTRTELHYCGKNIKSLRKSISVRAIFCTDLSESLSALCAGYENTAQAGLSRGSQSRKVTMESGPGGAWGMIWWYDSELPMALNWLRAASISNLSISSSCSCSTSATVWSIPTLLVQSHGSSDGPCTEKLFSWKHCNLSRIVDTQKYRFHKSWKWLTWQHCE